MRYIIGKIERDITQVLNCPISVNTFLLQKRTRQQPSSRGGQKTTKERKKNSVLFFKAVFFTSLRTHSVALSYWYSFWTDLAATSPPPPEMIRKRSKRPSRANRTGTPTKVPAIKNSRRRRRRPRPRRRRTSPTPEEPPPRRRCKPKEKKPATKGPSSNFSMILHRERNIERERERGREFKRVCFDALGSISYETCMKYQKKFSFVLKKNRQFCTP